MLFLHLAALMLALPQFLLDALSAIASPVLVPLVTSLVMFALNTWTRLVGGLPNPVKQLLVMIIGLLVGWVGQRFGLDVTTAQGFAGSLVALGIFQLGKTKAPEAAP